MEEKIEMSQTEQKEYSVITVNLPISYIKIIDDFVGNYGVSRCELIRIAIRDFLLKQLEIAKGTPKVEDSKPIQQSDNFVSVPYENGLRTYRIVRK